MCAYVCVTHARCVHVFLRASFNFVLVCVCVCVCVSACVCVCAEMKTDGNTQASTCVHFILSVYINTLYEGD